MTELHTSAHSCDACETDLSAILDAELKAVDLTATLDHLVDCPRCADFYRKSRALGLAVADSSTAQDTHDTLADDAAVLERVWARISERADCSSAAAYPANDVRRETASGWRTWAPRLAAVVVVGFGLWLVPMLLRTGDRPFAGAERAAVHSSPTASSADIQVRPGELEMSDVRFVELATEVLRADPRYHQKMLEVMKSITRAEHLEGAVDLRSEDDGEAAEEEFVRGEMRSNRSLL